MSHEGRAFWVVDPHLLWAEDFTQGKWKVFTANSTYLLDCDESKVKRIHGGENLLSSDGEWIEYHLLGPCQVGKQMEFVWVLENAPKLRVTSRVEAIHRWED